jgi:hypothetical protein
VSDGSHSARVHHDFVSVNERVLVDGTEDVTTSDVISDLEVDRGEVPLEAAVEGGGVDSARNVDRVGLFGDVLEGTLNTVVDVGHETCDSRA